MTTNTDELQVKISLSDKLSAGLGKVGGQLERLNQRATHFQEQLRGNFDDMIAGIGSAVAAGAGIYAALSPGVELERALSGIDGTDLTGSLDEIRHSAQQFSREFGMASSEFVQNAALVKRAIGKVNTADLGAITAATSTLASATNSDVNEVSQYLGRMYHAYQDEADKMGKVDFWKHLVNMNAVASRSFGISAESMAGAMESISSLAKNYSVSLPEQMAVLGTLRTELSESDAASYYEAFIRDANKLKELDINVMDKQGKMLPMLNILDQIKAKVGQLNGADFKALDDACGDGAMVIHTLMRQEAKLRKALSEMKAPATTALDAMAKNNTDALKQLSGSWGVLQETLSQSMMPVVNAVAGAFTSVLNGISDLAERFPNLTAGVIGTVVALSSLVALASTGSVMLSMMRTASAALSPVFGLNNGLLGRLTLSTQSYTVASMLAAVKARALAAAQWELNLPFKAMLHTFGALASAEEWMTRSYTALTGAIRNMTVASLRQAAATKIMAAGQMLLNVIMSMNPLGLLVAGLVIAGMMIMRYWQPIKAFFCGFVEGLRASGLFDAFAPLVSVFSWIWDKVKAIGSFLFGWLAPIEYASDELAGFADVGMRVGQMIGNFFKSIADTVRGMFRAVVELLNKLPGIDIELPAVEQHVSHEVTTAASTATANSAAALSQAVPSAQGAITQAVAETKPQAAALNPAQTVLKVPDTPPAPQEPTQHVRTAQVGNINIYPQTSTFSLLDIDEQELLSIG